MKTYKEIVIKFDRELDTLEIEIEDVLVKAEKGIRLTKQALKDIRDLDTDCEFETKQEAKSIFS